MQLRLCAHTRISTKKMHFLLTHEKNNGFVKFSIVSRLNILLPLIMHKDIKLDIAVSLRDYLHLTDKVFYIYMKTSENPANNDTKH